MDYVKEVSEEKYWEFVECEHFIFQYNVLVASSRLGLKFAPDQVTIEQLWMFMEIASRMENNKEGENGKR